MYIPSRHVEEIKGLLKKILDNQETEKQQEKKMAVSLDQLTTDVNTLQTTLNTGLTDLEAEIANLKAGNPTVDFAALDTIVNNMNTQVASADPGAQGTAATANAVKKS